VDNNFSSTQELAVDQGIAGELGSKFSYKLKSGIPDSCYAMLLGQLIIDLENKAGYYQCNMITRFGIDSGGGQITAANFYFNGSSQLVYGWCN
jgi:hypothetical protein